jgi:hypothetical protein
MTMEDANITYYTVANKQFFVGAVCLVNSLRLTGNKGEIVVLDQGLTSEQRSHLEPHTTLVKEEDIFGDTVADDRRVFLAKPYPRLLSPRGVVIIIDSDMIVTGSFDRVVESATNGRIIAYPNPRSVRSFEAWRSIFDLTEPLREQEYVCAGFLAFSAERWPTLLNRWWDCCLAIADGRGKDWPEAVDQLDQDALNALLMSEFPGEALEIRPLEESPSFAPLNEAKLIDEETLSCHMRGVPATILHHAGTGKPWHSYTWVHLKRNAYVRLIPRLLFWKDVPIPLEPSRVPLWLRPTLLGRCTSVLLSSLNGFKSRVILPLWRRVPASTRRTLMRSAGRVLPSKLRPPKLSQA